MLESWPSIIISLELVFTFHRSQHTLRPMVRSHTKLHDIAAVPIQLADFTRAELHSFLLVPQEKPKHF